MRIKLALTTVATLVAFSTTAFAASQAWNVTEEAASGIKGAQGTWSVDADGDKISGSATMQLANGNPLGYTLEGSVSGAVYTITLLNRTDGKKGCVWSGHTPPGAEKSHGLIGEVVCDGNAKFLIRAGF